MRLPPWLWGNDLLGFAAQASLKLNPVDVAAGVWDVETLEEYEHREPGLVGLAPLVEGVVDENRLRSALSTMPSRGTHTLTDAQVQAEVDRISTSRPDDVTALAAVISLVTLAAADATLPATIAEALSALRSSADGAPIFGDAGAYLIRAHEYIARRYALNRVLVRLHDDPTLFDRRPDSSEVGRAFASAQGLFSDTLLGFDAYLNPLLLAATPWVWAVDASRSGGVIVYSLGRMVVGRKGEASELVQLFLPRGGTRSGPAPAGVGPEQIVAALRWWVERLDRLFGHLTDPVNFCDASGTYQPRRHFEVLLGVEQAFRHTGSLLAHDRDRNARRVLLFSALDTLEGLGCIAFDRAVTVTSAQSVLTTVLSDLGTADSILGGNAASGLDGLREVQQGFFLPSRVTSSGVRVPGKNGQDRLLTKEQAAAQWLRILRNATHGFRGQRDKDEARDEALLMSHTGDVPENLPLLAYLHLLHLLAAPSQLERVIHHSTR